MNWDQVEGQWKDLKGSIRQKWAKLTDDDVAKIYETASTVDQKTMNLQYLEALKSIGGSASSKIVVPMELSGLVGAFSALTGGTNGKAEAPKG